MADFREHGVYGFVIHARMGLSREIPYMGQRWLALVQFAVEEAARTGMRVCLYDEGMYPSGSAHGEVVRSNPAFAARGLAMEQKDVRGPAELAHPAPANGKHVATVVARRLGEGKSTKLSELKLIEPQTSTIELPDGDWSVMVFACMPSGGRIRGVHEGEEDNQPNAPLAADLLNPEAMEAFIRLAYERYYEVLKEHFGKTVVAVFTDEPSMLGRRGTPGLKPWTEGFGDDFAKRRRYSLLPLLPALFHDAGPRTEAVRKDYELTLAERLDWTYYRPISSWCEQHGIALTGHPSGSMDIQPLRYFQMPGQDLVWRYVVPEGTSRLEGPHSTTAKCSSSVARHDGRRFNISEVYGAYGWNLTIEEMKWLADWLIVRGVNLLMPHAFYYSTRGYRGQERPPDVGPNNLWWPHYRPFADYTTRLCGLMTDARPVCDVAILGDNRLLPWRAAKWLYQNQVDFDYLEVWRLMQKAELSQGRIKLGGAEYAVLIVDQDEPPGGDLAKKLKALEAGGVRICYCRGQPGAGLIEGIDRHVICDPPAENLRCRHVVKSGMSFYLLVNEGESPIETRLTIRPGKAEWFDAWSGEFRPAAVLTADPERMTLSLQLGRRESLVLCVDPSQPPGATPAQPETTAKPTHRQPLQEPWSILNEAGTQVGEGLGEWAEHPGLSDFAGTLTYRVQFSIARRAGNRYKLGLGRVGDFAVVRLNGKDLGVRFWAPFQWDITGAVVDGRNELVVEITNSAANKQDRTRRRPSGLFGPVTIETSEEKAGTGDR